MLSNTNTAASGHWLRFKRSCPFSLVFCLQDFRLDSGPTSEGGEFKAESQLKNAEGATNVNEKKLWRWPII